MQAFLIKVVSTIGYELAEKLVGALSQAIYSVYTDKVIEQSKANMVATQDERRALVMAISRATSNEERRNLSNAYNKLTRM